MANLKSKTFQKRLQKGQGASDTIRSVENQLEKMTVREKMNDQMLHLAQMKYNSSLTDKFIVNLTGRWIGLEIREQDYEIRQEANADVTRFNTAIFKVAAVGAEVLNKNIVPGCFVWMNEIAFSGAAKSTPWGDRQGFLVVEENYVIGVVDGDYDTLRQATSEYIEEYKKEYQARILEHHNKRRVDLGLDSFTDYNSLINFLENSENKNQVEAAMKQVDKKINDE